MKKQILTLALSLLSFNSFADTIICEGKKSWNLSSYHIAITSIDYSNRTGHLVLQNYNNDMVVERDIFVTPEYNAVSLERSIDELSLSGGPRGALLLGSIDMISGTGSIEYADEKFKLKNCRR